jgi:transposase-like protein
MNPTSLFTVALGLQAPWGVADVAFDRPAGRIDFQVAFTPGARFACPHCGAEHQPVHDTQEREWRHLNFFQFEAYIHAKVPRVRCEACAKTTQIAVPWARANSGFTQLMEALIVTLCQAMPIRQVAQLLGVGDMRLWRTLDYYGLCYVLCGQGVRSLWFPGDPGPASPPRWQRGSMLGAGGLRVDKAWMSQATVGTSRGQLAGVSGC